MKKTYRLLPLLLILAQAGIQVQTAPVRRLHTQTLQRQLWEKAPHLADYPSATERFIKAASQLEPAKEALHRIITKAVANYDLAEKLDTCPNQIISDCISFERIDLNINDDVIAEIKKWMCRPLKFNQKDSMIFNKEVEIALKFQKIKISDNKIIDIFEVRLPTNLPEAIPKNHVLILDRLKKDAALLPIAQSHIIKLPNHDNLIGGIFWIRDKGYERIYQFNGICFFTLLDTSSEKFCSSGVPVARTKRDCMAYEGDIFDLTIKKDNDFLELNFSGKILTFCEGLERIVDIKSISPIQEQEVFLCFRGNFDNDTSINWVFVDSINYCPTIRKTFEF